jgi:hypothetical protein
MGIIKEDLPTTVLIRPGTDELGMWLNSALPHEVEETITNFLEFLKKGLDKSKKMNSLIQDLKKL